ncbi:hypothetical protein CWS51_24480 [Klebsiella michiganensis]|nr:hypothetical protein [Klebsiella michiganensis]
MSHKKEHTVMVKTVLDDLARETGQSAYGIIEQLFSPVTIVAPSIIQATFQRHYPNESFNHVIWCPFCECFDLLQTTDSATYSELYWTFSSTQFPL